jgi:hypothetical protein
MKQETLEEVAENYARKQCDDMYDNQGLTGASWGWETSLDFIAGAKWQAEKMYSEEDMRNAFDSAREFNSLDGVVDVHIVLPMGGDMSDLQPLHFTFKEWFEQFKKK